MKALLLHDLRQDLGRASRQIDRGQLVPGLRLLGVARLTPGVGHRVAASWSRAAGLAMVLAAAGVLASDLAARRAAAVDPVERLKAE